MKYTRKTFDEFEIQGLYFGVWECVTTEENFRDAKAQLKTYRENEKTAFRIVKKRIKKEVKNEN